MDKMAAAAPNKKAAAKKKAAAPKKITDAEAVHVPEEKTSAEKLVDSIEENKKTFEPEESEVKIDASSMTAVEDSVEVEEKLPPKKKAKTKTKEDAKTDPA